MPRGLRPSKAYIARFKDTFYAERRGGSVFFWGLRGRSPYPPINASRWRQYPAGGNRIGLQMVGEGLPPAFFKDRRAKEHDCLDIR